MLAYGMELKTWLTAPFKFSPVPVSVLLVLIYAAVFTSVSVTDETPDLPKDLKGLSLDEAYEDLHIITTRPHPVLSHANDAVHDYLLSRLEPIVASQEYIHLSNDLTSNATFASQRSANGTSATYYEGTNILVKVDGTDAPAVESSGVLFSAHFDSVSTAPGATDNGMSIVTLLQMIKYLADPKRRPRRTAVFLFNNGEEDGLNGARMYFEHPWSNLTKMFINLEGAASGGRPILFRSTSLAAARSFSAEGVIHPHGNVLSADAFAQGVVRSATDYEVFAAGIKNEKKGMDGLDFAFYKNRAFYHTKFDSIPGMGHRESRKALWAMMETVRGAGQTLLNDDEVHDDQEPGIYFDILGNVMVTMSKRALFVLHVTSLVIGPLVVLGLLAWVMILTRDPVVVESGEPSSTWSRVTKAVATVVGWGRFWISLLITISIHVGFVAGYAKINPYVIYSRPYMILITTLSTTFLTLGLSLKLFYKLWPSPPSSQKLAIILEIYLLSWITLVGATVLLNNAGIGGVYVITVWNVCAWLAALLALTEAVVRARSPGKYGRGELNLVGEPLPREEAGHRFVAGVRYDPPGGAEDEDGDMEPVQTEPTEITPLMQQHRRRSVGGREYVVGIDNDAVPVFGTKGSHAAYEESGWWIVQMLVLIPAPAILLTQIDVLLMHALKNTLADGSSPLTVYGGLSVLSLLIFINIAPFAHNIHRAVYTLVLAVFVVTLVISWTSFPFTQDAPLKIFFHNSVEINSTSTAHIGTTEASAGGIIRSVTRITGLGGYTDNMLIPELPSSYGKNVTCSIDKVNRRGLPSCIWESDLIPSPGGNTSLTGSHGEKTPRWFTLHNERLNTTAARFTIQGVNTRNCQLLFDHPVTSLDIIGSGTRVQPGHEIPKEGVNAITLWSRTWGKKFEVEVAWGGANPDYKMRGRAICNWAEFASGTAGSPHESVSAQVPAYEEVLQFLPLWAVPTKWTVGLVEVWTRFTV